MYMDIFGSVNAMLLHPAWNLSSHVYTQFPILVAYLCRKEPPTCPRSIFKARCKILCLSLPSTTHVSVITQMSKQKTLQGSVCVFDELLSLMYKVTDCVSYCMYQMLVSHGE